MENGTVLVDTVSGLKIMIVDQGLPAFNPHPEEFAFQGRSLIMEDVVPAGKTYTNLSITCDPGDRSKG